jgi:hypothetical protein
MGDSCFANKTYVREIKNLAKDLEETDEEGISSPCHFISLYAGHLLAETK